MKRSWNLRIWVGFVLCVAAFVSYFTVFIRYPFTRDFPWATLLLMAAALFLVASGISRAFRRADAYRGKISGSILGVLTVGIVGFFLVMTFYLSRQIPAAHGAPRVGETAPDFTLPDSNGNSVTLSSLIHSPFVAGGQSAAGVASGKTAAVILIFYRGYW
ncbi:MAG: hypothetical protein WA789_00400 [Candidatus Acidiferrum sp.]